MQYETTTFKSITSPKNAKREVGYIEKKILDGTCVGVFYENNKGGGFHQQINENIDYWLHGIIEDAECPDKLPSKYSIMLKSRQ